MRIGYARVSTLEQSLDLQLDALRAASCERIFTDESSSGRSSERGGLTQALSQLRKGDALVTWRLDRLGRSVHALIEIARTLEGADVELVSLTEGIDTATPAGRFFFHVTAALAQMERETIVERTRAGLLAARQRGRTGGRPRKMTEGKLESARHLLAAGTPSWKVAQHLGVSSSTLYRWIQAPQHVRGKGERLLDVTMDDVSSDSTEGPPEAFSSPTPGR